MNQPENLEKRPFYEKGWFSLLVLAGFGLFMLVGLQVLNFILTDVGERRQINLPSGQIANITGDVFQDLQYYHPKSFIQKEIDQEEIETYPLQTFYHNLRGGSPASKIKLVVFTDQGCRPCERQLQQVRQLLPKDTFIIVKYYPQKQDDMESGLFFRLAQEHPLFKNIRENLDKERGNLTTEDWVRVLEDSGVPLKEQRQLLALHSNRYMVELQDDINQGNLVGIEKIPAFVLNEYYIDGGLLTIPKMPRYASRILNGEPIVQLGDYRTFSPNQ